MRSSEHDRLNRKLARLLGYKRQACGCCHIDLTGRHFDETWSPSRNIAQALAAVEQAGLIVNTLSNYYFPEWYCRLDTKEYDCVSDGHADTPSLAVTLALIAALETKQAQ